MASHQFVALNDQDVRFFDGGLPAPNAYLQKQAAADMARGRALTVVAIETRSGQVTGFYTLAPAVVQYHDPGSHADRQVRVIVLKYLAYDVKVEGVDHGSALLADAQCRARRPDVGAEIMVVETQTEQHSKDFARFGFARDPANPRRLFARLGK